MAAARASRPGAGRVLGRFGVRHAVGVLAAVQALTLWLLGRTSMWRTDDWIYFADLHRRGAWSRDWLLSTWWKHIAPLHRATFSLMDHGSTATYTRALLFEIVLVAIAVLTLYAILELLFGRSWWLLVPLAVFGFSFQFALPLVWPSSGFQAMPETAASLVCTYAWLRHLRSGSHAWLAGAALALAIGLGFYIRPILLLPLLVALRLLFLEPSLRPAAVVRALWRERLTWAVLAVPVAAFIAYYLHRHAFGQREPLGLTGLQQYVREAWLRNVFPSMLGIREHPGALNGRHALAEAGAQLLLAALFALSLYRKGVDALRGWAFVLVALALTFALTATGKLAESGPAAIGLETRYSVNLMWLVPLGAAMALQPARVARLGAAWPSAAEARLRPLPTWAERAGAPLTVVATVLASVFAVAGAHQVIDQWGARAGRPWVANAAASAKRLAGERGRPVHLPDAMVPSSVLDNAFVGDAWRRTVLPYIGAPIVVGGPYDALQESDGTIVPATSRPVASAPLAPPGPTTPASGLAIQGGCLAAPGPQEGILDWPLPAPARGAMVTVGFPAGSSVPPSGVGVDVDSGYGLPPSPRKFIGPVGSPEVETGETTVVRLRLHIKPGEQLCAQSVSVSALDPG